jgi:hypothetical protein
VGQNRYVPPMPHVKGVPHPWQLGKPNTTCDNCDKPIHKPPSFIKKYKTHFCSNVCRYQYFTDRSKSQPRSPRVELTCKNCGKIFYRTQWLANKGHHKFCSQECHWEWKTSYASTYYKRDLECSPKQTLLRYLICHGFGIGHPYNNECEEVLCNVKSGFYVPGLSPHTNPLDMLAWKLKHYGYIGLARQVVNGEWEDEDKWLCNTGHMVPRSIRLLPWENQSYEWP